MATFWDNITRFEVHKVAPWLGLRGALGVALPLAAGTILGAIPSGLVMATGALNVSFSDSYDPYIQRAQRMLAASVVIGVGVFAGALCGRYRGLIVVASAVWAFAAGMLISLSPAAADLGTVSLVTLVVFAAVPMEPRQALYSGGLALAGGLVETALGLALWPLRRYVPEREALGDLYLEIARAAAAPVRAREAPPASIQSTAAQTALATLHRNHSLEAERYLSLLNQAERMRLALMMLGRLRNRLARENPQETEIGILDRFFVACSTLLREIGNALQAGGPLRAPPELHRELDQLVEALRDACGSTGMERGGMMREARFQMDALLGQIRSAVELASRATPEGAEVFERQQAATPWRAAPGRNTRHAAGQSQSRLRRVSACRPPGRLRRIGRGGGPLPGTAPFVLASHDDCHRAEAGLHGDLQPRRAAPVRHLRGAAAGDGAVPRTALGNRH